MEFTSIDFAILAVVIFLSMKGFFTGFSLEILNLFGIIGGIGIASRKNIVVGEFINKNIYPITDISLLELVGFIVTFLAVWLFFNILSSPFKRNFHIGIFSRILGYFVSIIKYLAIFGVILYGLKQSQLLSDNFLSRYQDSKLLPTLIDIGGKLLNQDKNITFSDINSSKDINLSNFNLR